MKPLSALLPLCALCGCASLSSYQEARVLGEGQGLIAIAATPYLDDRKVDAQDTSSGNSTVLIEVATRLGIWKDLDVGIKYSFPGAVSADAKYQLIGRDSNSTFQFSGGLKGGYADVEVGSGSNVQDFPVIDLIVPLYASWTPKTWVGLTVAPEFCYRISDNSFYPSGPIAGANVDLRLGKKAGVLFEYGYHRHLTENYALQNYGIAAYAPFEFHSILSMVGL